MSRVITLVCLLVSTLLVVFVFVIKYSVQDLETEYQSLNRQIEKEQRTIHILKAEWSYLNEPLRLQALSELYLQGTSLTYAQMEALVDIPMKDVPGSSTPGALETTDPTTPVGDNAAVMATIEAVLRELREKGAAQ
jgi:hypothetical protein